MHRRAGKEKAAAGSPGAASLLKNEIHGQHQAYEGREVVPAETDVESDEAEHRENEKRDAFLDDLELNERKGTAVHFEADTVCRDHTGVLKERYRPGENDDERERPVGDDFGRLQLQVQIPGARHENVGDAKQRDCREAFGEHDLFIEERVREQQA